MKLGICKKFLLLILVICLVGTTVACAESRETVVEESGETEEEIANVINEEKLVEIPTREYELYIAVPIESMSMRKTPGYGDDIVTTVFPETLLKEIGEPEEASGKQFYHIATLDGQYEGYCVADYCIKISYEYDMDELNIVDTEDAKYTYQAMEEDLYELENRYGDYLSVDVIGQSAEQRNLYRVVLGNPSAPNKIFIQAGIHGREYMSCQQVMKMIEYYAANYNKGYYDNRFYSELFENNVLHIIPMSNPDGVSISQMGEAAVTSSERITMMREAYERDKDTLIYTEDSNGYFFWYDTYTNPSYDRYANGYDEIISYADYLTLWKANANGVDINRNFNAGWEDIHQKEKPGCEFFKGYSADSEPETIALEKLIEENNYMCILNYHAKGQIIYYDVAGNSAQMSAKSQELAQTVSELNRHQIINCQDSASVVLGGLGDWAMLSQNTPSITIEIGKKPCPLGKEEFSSIWHRGREVWAKVMSSL